MNPGELITRKRAPLLLHASFFLFLLGPPLIAGYIPFRRIFSDPDQFLLVWPIFLLIWLVVFLWMLFETTKRDILLAASFPILAIILLISSNNLGTALLSGVLAWVEGVMHA